MTSVGWLEIALFAAMIGLLARPLGGYLARVYGDNGTLLQPLLGPIEDTLYRLAGIKPEIEHSWLRYTVSLLVFHAVGIIALYSVLRFQGALPLNPVGLGSISQEWR